MTATWNHARVAKRIVNMDSGDFRYITCGWHHCGLAGLEIYKARVHDHAKNIGCDDIVDIYLCEGCNHNRSHHPDAGPCACGECPRWEPYLYGRYPAAKHTWFVFCSHTHLMYWTHAHIPEVLDGNLPPGERNRL